MPRYRMTLSGPVQFTEAEEAAADAEELEFFRQNKRAELKSAYESTLSADIDYNSKTYSATKERRELLSEILSVGSVPEGMYLIDVNGDQNPMTYADIQAIGQALLSR
ncbi:hypothetical protein [Nitrosomonas marina]|uniref:Uncharacterized protein n=1 Tax=Nitrosomonas marina TaxID=917 RepID=A0A1H8GIM1_9PROT|nr:hypothetical protein [Nitrosomonas marina]SEN43158.1 hypothetical protein SAMN05216325_11816 [Nitrosomonas marina]